MDVEVGLLGEDQQIDVILKLGSKVLDVKLILQLLLQRIVHGGAAAKSYLPFVFGVGGAEDHSFLRMFYLDKQGDQFRGAVSHNDPLRDCPGVGGQASA